MSFKFQRITFITGRPGIGKTTLVKKLWDYFKGKIKIVGFITIEVREGNSRVGFKIINTKGEEDWLAHIELFKGGPRVGKYWVNVSAIERIGLKVLEEDVEDAQLITIDEIGPMELKHPRFLQTVRKVLDLGKYVVATIHIRCQEDPELRKLISRSDATLITLTFTNRDYVAQSLQKYLAQVFNVH